MRCEAQVVLALRPLAVSYAAQSGQFDRRSIDCNGCPRHFDPSAAVVKPPFFFAVERPRLGRPQATPVRSFGPSELQGLQRPQTGADRSLAVLEATAAIDWLLTLNFNR